MENSINQVLAKTDQALDTFITEIKKSPEKSKKPIDELSHTLAEHSQKLKYLRTLKKDQVIAQTDSNPEITLIQLLLKKLNVIKNDKTTQEKVAALQATIFWDYIEDFQNLLLNKNLKDEHRRGVRVEKLDSLDDRSE